MMTHSVFAADEVFQMQRHRIFSMPSAPLLSRYLHRLTQMSSRIGYYLTFSYQGTDVNTGAWGALAHASLFKASAPSTPRGQLTYGSNGTITDLAGRVFTCSACTNAINAQAEAVSGTVTLPGETTQAKVVISDGGVPGGVAAVRNCHARNEFATKTKPHMCLIAARSNDDFKRIYSLTPRKIWEL